MSDESTADQNYVKQKIYDKRSTLKEVTGSKVWYAKRPHIFTLPVRPGAA